MWENVLQVVLVKNERCKCSELNIGSGNGKKWIDIGYKKITSNRNEFKRQDLDKKMDFSPKEMLLWNLFMGWPNMTQYFARGAGHRDLSDIDS